MSFGYSRSVNIIQLLLCGNTELVAKNNSAWMFDAPLQLQGILLQSVQLLCTLAFVLVFCVCERVSMTVCSCVVHIFFKIILHTMDLFDNCAVGDINYTFSIFTVSSHHLQGSVCVWGWRKWARALLYLPVFKRSLFPSALPEPSCIKEQEIHYAYLRCFGRFLSLLSKLDNSSAGVWCCSTLRQWITDYSYYD